MRRPALLFFLVAALSGAVEARAFVSPASLQGRCPIGMTLVPGGAFTIASTKMAASVGTFCLDRTEVTTGAYRACSTSGRCGAVPDTIFWSGMTDSDRETYSKACNGGLSGRDDHPINCIDWQRATDYCAAIGRRLPTEEEWEWAARGGSNAWKYPWGDAEPEAQLCWSGISVRNESCPVGAFPQGANPWGIHDLAGNVVEWTSSAMGETGWERVLRGGAWATTGAASVSAADRYGLNSTDRRAGIGFRCARTY